MIRPRKIDGVRTYTIDGQDYPSVTTILKVVNKPGLNYWITSNAVKAALKLRDSPQADKHVGKNAKDAPKRVLSEAIQRGIRVHKFAEAYVTEEPLEPTDGYEEAVEKFFMDYMPHPMLTEVTVYNPLYVYAGTADLVARINGDTWLIDYKTSKKMYPEMHLQVSAYAHCPYYLGYDDVGHTLPYIGKLGVVLFHESGEVSFKEVQDAYPAFLNATGLWKWYRSWEK